MTPTKHASRSRVRRPRAGTRRGVLSTITPPVVSSPEPVAAVVNRPKSTSIGSSIQHHARGIQSRNPKFPGRSFTSIDIHPSAHAVETDTKKSKRNGNPRAGPSPSSRRRRRRYAPSSQTASLGMPCSASARARVRARVDANFFPVEVFTIDTVRNIIIRNRVPVSVFDKYPRAIDSAFSQLMGYLIRIFST